MKNYSHTPLKVSWKYFAKRLSINLTKASIIKATHIKEALDLRLTEEGKNKEGKQQINGRWRAESSNKID